MTSVGIVVLVVLVFALAGAGLLAVGRHVSGRMDVVLVVLCRFCSLLLLLLLLLPPLILLLPSKPTTIHR